MDMHANGYPLAVLADTREHNDPVAPAVVDIHAKESLGTPAVRCSEASKHRQSKFKQHPPLHMCTRA